MNGLLKHSNLSLSSIRPPSILSLSTTNPASDTYTVDEGIGTASGRALYAVGAAALKGIETLAIRRRLRVINAFFPHADNVAGENIETIYHDVLELTRPGLYRPQVRKQALRVLMVQIGRRQTRHLLLHLVRWPTIEITLFLSEILSCMPSDWLPPDTKSTDMHRELFGVYNAGYHPAAPLIVFITKLARVNSTTCQAILDAGFLDILLCMYACSFTTNSMRFPSMMASTEKNRIWIHKIASAALMTLCRQSDVLPVVSAHPICILLWRPLPSTPEHRMNERRATWQHLGPIIVARRLATLQPSLPVAMRDADWAWLTDLSIDLVEFTREPVYGSDNAEKALAWIRMYLELCETHQEALNEALDQISLGDRQHIFSRLVSIDYDELSQGPITCVPAFAPHFYFPLLASSSSPPTTSCQFQNPLAYRPFIRVWRSTIPSKHVHSSRRSLAAYSPIAGYILAPGDLIASGACLQGEPIAPALTPQGISHHRSAQEFEVIRRLCSSSYVAVYLVREVLSRPVTSQNISASPDNEIQLVDKLAHPPAHYGCEYAIKCLSKANLDEEALAAQMSEVTIHHSLTPHPNITSFHGAFETPSFLLLVQEYVPGEDLFYLLEGAHVQRSSDPLHVEQATSPSTPPATFCLLSAWRSSQLLSRDRLLLVASIFSQLCEAVATCHEQQVFHRDLNPEHIVVIDDWTTLLDGSRQCKAVVKLTDFGLSTTDIDSSDIDCGSEPYMSYECRNNVAPTYKPRAADVWSLGIVLINMLYHFNPWQDAAHNVCYSFDLYRQKPIGFLMRRCPGMTRLVAEFLASKVFCPLEDPNDDSQRISAREFGTWAKNLPALLPDTTILDTDHTCMPIPACIERDYSKLPTVFEQEPEDQDREDMYMHYAPTDPSLVSAKTNSPTLAHEIEQAITIPVFPVPVLKAWPKKKSKRKLGIAMVLRYIEHLSRHHVASITRSRPTHK